MKVSAASHDGSYDPHRPEARKTAGGSTSSPYRQEAFSEGDVIPVGPAMWPRRSEKKSPDDLSRFGDRVLSQWSGPMSNRGARRISDLRSRHQGVIAHTVSSR